MEVKIPTSREERGKDGHAGIFGKGVNEVQFKIKDQDYFLAFVEQEKRWYVFAPTSEGVNRIAVYVDAVKYQKTGLLETETGLLS